MDNNDEIILPEIDEFSHVDTPPQAPQKVKKSHRGLFLTIVILAFVALAGSLAYVVIYRASDDEPTETTDEPAAPSIKYDNSLFSAAMSIAEERLEVGDYGGAESAIANYSVPERMTSSQKYRYYSLLASLYSPEKRDNPKLFAEYTSLVEESLKSIRKGEE